MITTGILVPSQVYSPKQEPPQYSHPSRFSSMDASAISHLGSSKQVTLETNLTAPKCSVVHTRITRILEKRCKKYAHISESFVF